MNSDYKSKGLGAGSHHNRTYLLLLGLLLASLSTTVEAKGSLSDRITLEKVDTVRQEALKTGSTLEEANDFLLGQESSYDGYVVLEEPFTSSDKYLYMDSFFIGLKLDDFYENSDECVDSFVFTIDDRAYLKNNRTLVSSDPTEFWLHPLLNLTGMVGGPMSDIPLECYVFYKSIREREQERWERFDKSWSNFFLAFLFNQMGNALAFQQKFENIRINKETQNFQGVWLEYGDLLHVIWDFEPLEDAALAQIDTQVARYLNQTKILDNKELNPVEQYLIQQGATALITHYGLHADRLHAQVNAQASDLMQSYLSPLKENYDATKRAIVTAPAFEGGQDTGYLLYGFINGAIDVFPSDSLPDLCRDNSTTIYDTVNDIFIDWNYDLSEDDVEFAEDIQQMMQFPYGFTFSCFFATQ